MKLLLPALVAVIMLPHGAFAQAGPESPPAGSPEAPAQPDQRAVQENDLTSLAGAPWSETPKLQAELARVETGIGQLLAAGKPEDVLQAIEHSNGTDLLAQAIYRGLMTSANQGQAPVEVLKRFHARIGETGDPVDLPDRLRSWVPKSVMNPNLAARIAALDPNAASGETDAAPPPPRRSPAPRPADGASGPRGGQAGGATPAASTTEAVVKGNSPRTLWIGGGLVAVLLACWIAIRRAGGK